MKLRLSISPSLWKWDKTPMISSFPLMGNSLYVAFTTYV
nr:MAG TPA: hypothetical protein [Caudoviricetes sp.]